MGERVFNYNFIYIVNFFRFLMSGDFSDEERCLLNEVRFFVKIN